MPITAKTRLLGVMGWPVGHSRSPLMHAAAIAKAGIDYAYVAFPVRPENVVEAVRGLRALGFRGCNVTIPHKEAVVACIDELTPTAQRAGAVNTIVVEDDGRLVGHNTDVAGAMDAVQQETGAVAEGRHVLVLGGGGAARAAACGAAERRASKVTIVNRTVEKAQRIADEFAARFPETKFRATSEIRAHNLADVAIVLQVTSLGMKPGDPLPVDPALLPADCVALEAVYAPLETEWLKACRARGLRTVDGLAMLVAQGALSFEMWTGVPADRAAMRAAIAP